MATVEAPARRTPSSPRVTPDVLRRLAARVDVAAGGRDELEVDAPFSGELLGAVPKCTPEDVRAAAARARAAQPAWAARSFDERAEVFLRYHDLVLERQDLLLDMVQLEAGKARRHAFEELADTAIVARYYAHTAEEHLAAKRRRGALPLLTATTELRHPLGLVGYITPWNYPLTLAVTDAIPALMAGNAVLVKPDSQTPFTALLAFELLQEAGLPRDLAQVVTGSGSELGTPIIESVDFIMFTGSTKTGRVVASQAGQNLIGCSMELGGKNAMLVLEDAAMGPTVDGAVRGCFANAGQLCISIERLFVHGSRHAEFLSAFAARAQATKLGGALDYSVDMGALISADQLETVTEHVKDAVDKGARVVAGGRPRPDLGPYFYEPTILDGVREDMRLFSEETFGPVVAVSTFDSEDEAIRKANDSDYGLNFSVWTKDAERGRSVAERLQAGTVNVNEAYAATWASVDAPMGGYKDSGLGRRHGAAGIQKYCESQTVSIQRVLPVAAKKPMSEKAYARMMSTSLKVLKRLPGVR